MSDLHYWLALNSLSDIGPVLAGRLLSAFGTPEDIFNATLSEIRLIEGIGDNRAASIAGFNKWDRIEREIKIAERSGVSIITLNDRRYPEELRRIHNSPKVLYIRGRLIPNDRYAVAIVGSRKATDYGMQVAGRIGHKLAYSGLTVVSGMARGIDTASHRGALESGGRTIAVLGSGINVPYPHSNRKLMDRIVESGAVISEFPIGTPPMRENFPRRNRIISALSLGTTVIEATLDSGSLITVGYALEQGKEIFAVPGNITSSSSSGTNDLIKKGAKLVETAEEIIEELRPQIAGSLNEERIKLKKALPEMSTDESRLYSYLDSNPKHIDSITRELNMPAGKISSLLLHLELKGIIRQSEGKHFCLS